MNSQYPVGVVMDPIDSIKAWKDTSFAMLLEAQRRGCALYYFEPADLHVVAGVARGRSRRLSVIDVPKGSAERWFEFGDVHDMALSELAVILMRRDPPFDMEYVYTTYILDLAEAAGSLVVNRPSALRDFNEKMSITRYPELCAPTRVDCNLGRFRSFLKEHGDIVIKPLDGMGGASIFRLREGDPNVGVALETLTAHGRRYAMAQRFVPQISEGDKRILVIDGEPWPRALARIPAPGETRGNLAAGGRGEGRDINDRDREICAALAPMLREQGLLFVGIDVIGDWLTEINVTSPTCVRELDAMDSSNICAGLFDAIEARI